MYRVAAKKISCFPVLPVRLEGKLIFPLCFACAKEKQQACNHVETERYLCGTWTSVEINKAVEKEYQIVEIFRDFTIINNEKQIFWRIRKHVSEN